MANILDLTATGSIWLVLVLLLAAAAYYDVKYSRIPNAILSLFFCLGAAIYLAEYFFGGISVSDLMKNFFDFLVSLIVGYLLWSRRMWFAGDAKLFAVVALLIPASLYSAVYIPYFYSFSLLCNIFILAFLYLFFFSLPILFNRGKIREILDITKGEIISYGNETKRRLAVLDIFIIAQMSAIEIVSGINFFIIVLLLFIFGQYLHDKLAKIRLIKTEIVFFLIFFEFSLLSYFYFFSSWLMFLWLLVFWLGLRGLVFVLVTAQSVASRKVNIDEIKVGDFLAPSKDKTIDKMLGRPLTEEDIGELRMTFGYSRVFGLEKSFPFIGFILLGVLATILLKGQLAIEIFWHFSN